MNRMRAAIVLSIVSTFIASCSEPATDVEPVSTPRPVKLVTVDVSSNRFPLSYPAVVEAARSTTMTFQVGGLVNELSVVRGQDIKRGDLIARIDARDYANSVAAARAQYDNAQSEYERAEGLSRENAIAQSVVEARRSQRDVARAQLQQAQKALDDATLRAPFDGRISDVLIEQFQNVAPQSPVAVLQTSSSLEATIDVPAVIVAQSPNYVEEDTVIVLDAAPGVRIPAEFKEFTAEANPTNQTYRASFTFESPSSIDVLPGMTGTLSTVLIYEGPLVEEGVSAPFSAVLTDGDARFVWVVDPDEMTVARRQVEIADQITGETVTIVGGLTKGEMIVGAGAAYLHEGMRVSEWNQ